MGCRTAPRGMRETAFQCRRIIAWGFPTPLSRKTIRGFSLRGSEEDQVFPMREIAGPGPLVSFWPAGIQGWILGRVLLSTLPCGQGLWALMVWMGYFGFMGIRRGAYTEARVKLCFQEKMSEEKPCFFRNNRLLMHLQQSSWDEACVFGIRPTVRATFWAAPGHPNSSLQSLSHNSFDIHANNNQAETKAPKETPH
jgi:hypothetical protein